MPSFAGAALRASTATILPMTPSMSMYVIMVLFHCVGNGFALDTCRLRPVSARLKPLSYLSPLWNTYSLMKWSNGRERTWLRCWLSRQYQRGPFSGFLAWVLAFG